jgi:CHASE2 domain-containing sensor protein/two-component sensor histidine kinase
LIQAAFWKKIKQLTKVWREVILPGAFIVGLVVVARLAGFLQVQELMAFDDFMRLRISTPPAPRVVIVSINEADLALVGSLPVQDRDLAKMLRILQEYQPRVIGLDIFRNLPVEPGHTQLVQAFKDIPNIIGIEVGLNQEDTLNVKPPPGLPPQRVGFADLIVDEDGKLRRSLLASPNWQEDLKYSFSLRLAQAYLSHEGITLEHGNPKSKNHNPKSTDPIRFGSIELPRFVPNTGGYIRADANGNQILLNFCAGYKPFRTISLTNILQRKFDPSWISDRIVIIGMTAASIKDTFITAAVKSTQVSATLGSEDSPNQLIYGVEIHAHAAGQIIRAVLDKRPLLKAPADFWEYLWIIFWGFLGMSIGLFLQSPWRTILSIGFTSFALVGICYLFLSFGWWVPSVPALLALSGAGLTTSFFDRDSRFLLEQRRLTIERTYDAVHNGPLQQLAVILRSIGEGDLSVDRVRSQLQDLNQELRSIYESMRQQVLTHSDSLYLKGNLILSLQTPIGDLLYQVYDNTLNREFPCFATIMTYIPPDFKPLEKCSLTLEQKRGLCLFLEEALCNVGKHAIGATRLDVICTKEAGWYSLQVIDNGIGYIASSYNSKLEKQRGTRQAQDVARQIRGRFERLPHNPQGTISKLTWRVSKTWRKRFW